MSNKAVWCPDVLYLHEDIHRSIHAIFKGTRVDNIHCDGILNLPEHNSARHPQASSVVTQCPQRSWKTPPPLFVKDYTG